jgi:hypothetical protein
MFFAVTGALLDASITSWAQKYFYNSERPITAIHYLYSDIPVRPASRRRGEPFPCQAALARQQAAKAAAPAPRRSCAQVAPARALSAPARQVESWAGPYQGTKIILGGSWLPFQPPSTITPSFPSFTSAHSTFSAAATQARPHPLRRRPPPPPPRPPGGPEPGRLLRAPASARRPRARARRSNPARADTAPAPRRCCAASRAPTTPASTPPSRPAPAWWSPAPRRRSPSRSPGPPSARWPSRPVRGARPAPHPLPPPGAAGVSQRIEQDV